MKSFWQKNKTYLLLMGVLLAVSMYLLYNQRPGTLKADRKMFAVTDTANIVRIVLSKGADTLNFERKDNYWHVNGTTRVKERSMKAFMNQLANIEITAPVANSMKSTVNELIKKNSVTIKIYNKSQLMRFYHLAESDSLGDITFASSNGDDGCWQVGLAGVSGRIASMFPTYIAAWMDNTLFDYQPSNILSVEVNYPSRPAASFKYRFLTGGKLQISSPDGTNAKLIGKELARTFLMGFASVRFESFLRNGSKRMSDSLLKKTEYSKISILDTDNKTNTFLLYQRYKTAKPVDIDFDRLYAVKQNDTLVYMVKYVDFDLIMRDRASF
jgi:hypothetical protein